eukprot:scaffold15906_cov18-Tisochrysis_lutea.AAC.1
MTFSHQLFLLTALGHPVFCAPQLTVVFAQLHTRGKWEGVHAFAVCIRDDQLNAVQGVRIKDMGPKQGLNGVDNGQIWFSNLRVPRDALLDKYGT